MKQILPRLKNLPAEIEKTLPDEVKQFRQFLKSFYPEYFEVKENA